MAMGGPLIDIETRVPTLVQVFQAHDVVLAYLYGSQARGDAGPLSDVDIAVQFAPHLSAKARFERLCRLGSRLMAALGRDDVYVADLDSASPLLRNQVRLHGRLLYCADDADRVRFEIEALRDYEDTKPLRHIQYHYTVQYFGAT